MCLVPALVAGIACEMLLAPRHDYAGHFVAGYGGTLAAAMYWLKTRPAEGFSRRGTIGLCALCLVCIGLGAIVEGTVSRSGKFDEIDFLTQSMGAVLACLAALAWTAGEKPSKERFHVGCVAGVAFVVVGGCLALA